jgi:LmbE family N-acetylglucosaminyl deacetylase
MLVLGERGLAVSRVLCIGAHSDDIEIGCGGTLMQLIERCPGLSVDWLVLSASDDRRKEAEASAARLLSGVAASRVWIEPFRERYFPYQPEIKERFDALQATSKPDLVFTHWSGDAHQDHRVASELTANTFRDHLILEYEIPKYDGDLGRPSVYVRLTDEQADAKVEHLDSAFPSQRSRPWYDADTFRGLMRLRGVECNAPSGMAEAFHARKVVLA